MAMGSGHGQPGRPLRILDTVLAFLANHRGEVFCADCLSTALFVKKPSESLRAAEGHGANRRHGHCSQCGKPRLVSGLSAKT
jgi:hypothetical protein